MPLTAGARLGPYEVLEPLGAGGMGEVYKARDTRLERLVAIKVLPAHLSDNPENRERFEREARAISGLNHPHICTLHDIGREAPSAGSGSAIDFLVMEYLDGETLAARLTKGAIPLDQALALAIQVADALDRAHRQGIVHRDLKPANVMLVKSGASQQSAPQAKLLDFGLAKLSAGSQAVGAVSMLPTVVPSADLTAQGMIVGTLQYMAPEQLEGTEADTRTDVFAFGALVYEMVTGRKAFQGKSQPSLISAIMSADAPSISAAQAMSPPALDHLVKTCLAKDPLDRWQTMRDVMAQLKWIAEGGSQVGVPAPVTAARRTRSKLMMGLLAAAAVLLVAMAVPTLLYFRGAPEPDAIRFNVEVPPPTPNPTYFALSPDGRRIAVQATTQSGRMAIFVRQLDSTTMEEVPGSVGGGGPFWSPDSRYLAFFANGALKKVAVSGGSPQDIIVRPDLGAASWGSQGTILFGAGTSLYVVSDAGGEPRQIELSTTSAVLMPHFLPDGNHFLYTTAGDAAGIYVAALDSKDARLLVPGLSSGIYADPGFLLFHRQGAVFAQAFDLDTLTLSGDPQLIVDDVAVGSTGRAAVTASRTGMLLYRSIPPASIRQLVWRDRNGGEMGPAGKPAGYLDNFDLSPDGKEIAVSIYDPAVGTSNLWVMDWARGVSTPLTFTPYSSARGRDVQWSPDSLRLAYSRRDADGVNIVSKNSSGLGDEQVLVDSPGDDWIEDWSRDNRYVVYAAAAKGATDIWARPLFGDRKPFPVVESPFPKDEPHFSFDGEWLAYMSMESGTPQIFVISFPARDQKRQISDTNGTQPRWNRAGTELYYLRLDGKMMAASITAGPKLDSGVPRALFDTDITVIPTIDQYDVTDDGQRFLVFSQLSEDRGSPLTVVVNWTQLLKK